MKKIMLFMCVALCLILAGCNPFKFVPPATGTWASDFPILTFLVLDDGDGVYYGTYNKDGQDVEVVFCFSGFGSHFQVYFVQEDNKHSVDSEYRCFGGNYKIEDDKIYYTLRRDFKELYGITEIVFTRISD